MSNPPGALRLHLKILAGEIGAMGPGKADLLEAIQAYGSISAAGRALAISYRRCWTLVDEMNRCWTSPLVEARRGGSGQGARVTAEGAAVLTGYRALQARLADEAASSPEYAALRSRLLETPAGEGAS